MRSAGERSSDLSRSLGAEQQEQEHASIVLTTWRRGSLECRGLTRVPCRRDDRRRRSRDSPGGVAPGTQREQGNKNMGDDETEVPRACQASFSLAPTHGGGVRIYPGIETSISGRPLARSRALTAPVVTHTRHDLNDGRSPVKARFRNPVALTLGKRRAYAPGHSTQP